MGIVSTASYVSLLARICLDHVIIRVECTAAVCPTFFREV
jgi:hypothetical protein